MTDAARAIDTALLDPDIPASEDFYLHVNGRWLAENPVPPEYSSWGAFHEVLERNQEILHRLLIAAAADPGERGTVRQLVGDYFAAAMDEAAIAETGVDALQPILDRIAAAQSVADVRAIARDLQRGMASVFHSLGIAPDFEESSRYLVYVGQGGLGLPERDYYTRDDERSAALRSAYLAHIANQLANLDYAKDAALEGAQRVLAFETRLARASYTAEQMRDIDLTMNRHAVSNLDRLMPGFGLSGYVADLGVTSSSVNIDNAGFFAELEAALAETPIETLRDYLRFHVIRAHASALSPAFENEAFDFYGRTLGGQKEMRPRWKRVLDAASADIGEAVAQLYVAEAFPESAKHRCEEMVEHLLSAMGGALRAAEWMGPETREQALLKLEGFTYKIGYPDAWRDYAGLEVRPDSYAQNRMRCADVRVRARVHSARRDGRHR